MTWYYKKTDVDLYTVGFFDPTGRWHPDSDHTHQETAAARVAWLNGGQRDAIDVANNAIIEQMQREKRTR